jgi:transcriptional regulator with XRE-family HTH domain
LPFSTLDKTLSRLPKGYPNQPKTIGEHLLKRRIDLKLTKVAVAKHIKVSACMIAVWEKGVCNPEAANMKNVIEFLGYYPLNDPKTLGDRIKKYRYMNGLNLEEFGQMVEADGATVWTWENGKYAPLEGTIKKIEGLIQAD